MTTENHGSTYYDLNSDRLHALFVGHLNEIRLQVQTVYRHRWGIVKVNCKLKQVMVADDSWLIIFDKLHVPLVVRLLTLHGRVSLS